MQIVNIRKPIINCNVIPVVLRHIAVVEVRDMPDNSCVAWHKGYSGYVQDTASIFINSGLFESVAFWGGFLTKC